MKDYSSVARLKERRDEIQRELNVVEAQIESAKRTPNSYNSKDARERQSLLGRLVGTRIHELNQRRLALGDASRKLGRLISEAERPVVVPKGWKPLERWSPTPEQLAGGGTRKVKVQPSKKKGGPKASQRQQMRPHS
ncbi:hypothetical protein A2926_01310 [Candidatus Giovannonibacteria bacterium RIFCSPLOWO2_01_FULL_44_40]|uniref:Uncharacterized protein n=1 Tax=Candidatus Giovannonibacteria bacterium RIFCSPHIGHO2_01_FULL_45_23 TaxID=1798325 RepID=A0A1F5VIV8_9BACT|nr:MAG: hypothetical protein A2834_00625 [Candidatus Giovannonibacteria bacterium RIFCSPHIGHO2_01_FULL_45_23]OGF75866.1 MAG: hypothetical protein A3C77_02105 [Candidatus Giovannonibacteria bacterium RIFCSPHIGHO2_02_FULL_45_13]OGF79638.1 MAG: hypothetical protein A2926_01310 [Candidatus Giovannonibacteria bacterium RIFCSPLOWO2_01_FULL_44_40]